MIEVVEKIMPLALGDCKCDAIFRMIWIKGLPDSVRRNDCPMNSDVLNNRELIMEIYRAGVRL